MIEKIPKCHLCHPLVCAQSRCMNLHIINRKVKPYLAILFFFTRYIWGQQENDWIIDIKHMRKKNKKRNTQVNQISRINILNKY